MKIGIIGSKAIALLHGMYLSHQKTPEDIQAIPQDTKIHVRYFGRRNGWFRTELFYTWVASNVNDFVKDWNPADFEEFGRQQYIFMDWTMWDRMEYSIQRIYVDKFIAAHEPMIRQELDEHYQKLACNKTTNNS